MRKNIALIAHNAKKPAIRSWVREHLALLRRHNLFATAATGQLVREEGLEVVCFAPGPYGGDQQVGAEIVRGNIDMLFFFRDPLTAQPHEPDINALLRIGDVHDILMDTNEKTADVLIHCLDEE